MPILWSAANTVQRVGTAVANSPAGEVIVSQIPSMERDAAWLMAGWVALGAGFAWLMSDEPAKPHPDVELPASGAWHNVDPILCSVHPFWDCYTTGGSEGCLGRSV